MAYSTGKTSALQTAIKAAVDIAIAEFNAEAEAGHLLPDILKRVQEVKDTLTPELFAQVDEDNAASSAPARTSSRPAASNAAGITAQDAKDMVLNFGAFKGMSLGDVIVMTKDEASAYTSGKYERPGLEYVKWMSTNRDPKGAFAAARAKVILADFNQQTADLSKLAG